ncbi:MAG: hypothetical protein AB1714_03325 [Acidobacteriota bacterium]
MIKPGMLGLGIEWDEVLRFAALSTIPVSVIVEGVAQVKVKGDEASIRPACEQFLGKPSSAAPIESASRESASEDSTPA